MSIRMKRLLVLATAALTINCSASSSAVDQLRTRPCIPQARVTWDRAHTDPYVTLSNRKLTASSEIDQVLPEDPDIRARVSTRATVGRTSGRWYWEVTVEPGAINMPMVGVGTVNTPLRGSEIGETADGWGYAPNSGWVLNDAKVHGPVSYGPIVPDDGHRYVIGVAMDLDRQPGTLTFYKDGQPVVLKPSPPPDGIPAFSNLPTSTSPKTVFYPMVGSHDRPFRATAQFAPSVPPAGYAPYDSPSSDCRCPPGYGDCGGYCCKCPHDEHTCY